MAVVQLNNEIRELEIEERKEIEAILSNLSNEAAEHSEELVTDFEILTELDFIFARAMLGRSYKGTEPIFNDELKISIKQGYSLHFQKWTLRALQIYLYLGD